MKPWMFVLVVVLLLATCTARPGDRTLYPVRYGQEQVTVYLVDNGYHIDIALPAEALTRAGGPTAAASRQVTPRDWVLVGWGDAKFYTETGMSFARVLDGAVIGAQAQVGAGAVVPPGMHVPPGTLVMGVPARVRRDLSDDERANIAEIRDRYVALKEEYRPVLGDGF